MGKTLTEKILERHLISGRIVQGEVIEIKVDQVLTQDATGTLAYLQFEAMGVDKIKVPLAVSYVDHNMLQTDNKNPDDHLYLMTVAAKYGAYFSRPGNGICHQVHLERFAKPGTILLGSDSHTPTAGGIGAIGIGVGGLEIASCMAGEPFTLKVPKIVNIRLEGKLNKPYVCAMDVILEILRRLTVKGGVGKIFEYTGDGVKNLSVTERATITNMGAELGATSSIFPSDEITFSYLKAQGRKKDYEELSPDIDATYDEEIVVKLDEIEPLCAQPYQPDNVVKIRDIAGVKVNQVCIGSCTNSSYPVMKTVAAILKGKTVHPNVSLTISPGSKQVLEMVAKDGALKDIISSGARVLECACGPCIGMGQAPCWEGVSARTFNRNFKGRSGTENAKVYLVSPVSAAVAALYGEFVDPRDVNIDIPIFTEPKKFIVNDNLIIPPSKTPERVIIIRGPNIREIPVKEPLEDTITAEVLLKTGDNISTDDIMPAGAQILPLRSNIPAISEYVFTRIDKTFPERAKKSKSGIVVGGENYGQGSSREHAAIAPMYLGVKAIIAKSFARIHRANLINFGILPLVFVDPNDYNNINQNDILEIKNILSAIEKKSEITIINKTNNKEIKVLLPVNEKEKELLKEGGLLPYIKKKQNVK
jgi:aconitate hydratase